MKKKEPLKFRVEDGLQKVAELYQTLDTKDNAMEACWAQPQLLLESLIEDPVDQDIDLSAGYKKLADSISSLDFSEFFRGLEGDTCEGPIQYNDDIVTSLRHAVSGYDEADPNLILEAGGLGDPFNARAVVVIIMVVVTTSGSVDHVETPGQAPGTPAPHLMKQRQLKQLTARAQIVADQLGTYATH